MELKLSPPKTTLRAIIAILLLSLCVSEILQIDLLDTKKYKQYQVTHAVNTILYYYWVDR